MKSQFARATSLSHIYLCRLHTGCLRYTNVPVFLEILCTRGITVMRKTKSDHRSPHLPLLTSSKSSEDNAIGILSIKSRLS